MIDRHDVQDALYYELEKVIDRFNEEFDLSYADVIGAIEYLKADQLDTYSLCADWDEEDEDDEGEEWKK